MKLYEINSVIDQILEDGFAVSEETGEYWDMDELDQLEMDFDRKAESTACYIKNLEAEANAIKAEEESFAKRRKAIEGRVSRLKDYLTKELEHSGKKSLETPLCKLTTRVSERVEVYDEDAVPVTYTVSKTTVRPDKTEIRKALKLGTIIPGAVLVKSTSITVR